MKRIDLWRVSQGNSGHLSVTAVPSLLETKTEKDLEDLLATSPEILMPGLTLIGRQTPTEGGPLDLLGVDPDGRLVVFELKRGILTREALAQVVDYASFLHELDHEQMCRHIEERSGTGGVPKINDFAAWYSEHFADADDVLEESPRMTLVGLGVDDRTRRMTEFLTAAGVDISLITFHAFELDGQTLIARQTEVTSQKQRSVAQQKVTKVSNAQALQERIERAGVTELFESVLQAVRELLPDVAYEWPNLSTYAFQLPDRAESGNPSYRVYVSLVVDEKRGNEVGIAFLERASRLVTAEIDDARDHLPFEDYWSGNLTRVTAQIWSEHEEQIRGLLQTLTKRWEAQTRTSEDKSVDAE